VIIDEKNAEIEKLEDETLSLFESKEKIKDESQ